MLKIDFLGMSLENPLMLTEGPLSGNGELIRRAAEAGVGLIFTKGIRTEAVKSPVPYMSVYHGSLMNADWSCIGLEAWEETLKRLDTSIPLVTSVAKNYVSPAVAVEMAERLVRAGSKIISFVDYDPVELVATVKLARSKVRVPVMVKLPPFLPRLEERLKELLDAGVDAIAAMDSIGPGMSIDTRTGRPSLGSADGSGYVSGAYILPFTLKYIYDIARYVDVPVVGVGGVTDTDSALQMMMAGATGVGMMTNPMLKGLGVYRDIQGGLESYVRDRGLAHILEIRGRAGRENDRRGVTTEYRAVIDGDECINCGACTKVCYNRAITRREDRHEVNRLKCTGCGLCAGVCPVGAVTYR